MLELVFLNVYYLKQKERVLFQKYFVNFLRDLIEFKHCPYYCTIISYEILISYDIFI
jgi:hypothetical protein